MNKKKLILLFLSLFLLAAMIGASFASEEVNSTINLEDDSTQDTESLGADSLPVSVKTYDTEITVKEYDPNYDGNNLVKDLKVSVYSNETAKNGRNTAPGNLTLDFNKNKDTFESDDLFNIGWSVKAPKTGEYDCTFNYLGYTKQTVYSTYILKEIYNPSSITFKLKYEHKPNIILYTKDIQARRGDEVNISARITNSKEYYEFGRIVVKIDDMEYDLTKSPQYIEHNNFYTYNVSGNCVFNRLYTNQYSLICYPYNNYANNSVSFFASIKPKIPSLEVNVTHDNLILGDYTTNIDIKVINPERDPGGGYYLFVQKAPFMKVTSYNPDYSLKLDENNRTSTTVETMDVGLTEYRVYYTNLEDHAFYYFNVTLNQKSNIIVNPVTAQHNSNAKLIAYVKNNLNENIDGGFISFIIEGKTYTADVVDGVASVNFKMPSKTGTFSYVIKYNSNSKYTFESSSKIKVISKYGTRIIIKSVSGMEGKKVKLIAKIKTDNNKVIKNAIITFKINGRLFTAKTDSKGIAQIIIKFPKAKLFKTLKKTKGNILTKTSYYQKIYVCTVGFKGKGYYLSSLSTFKIASKKKPKVVKYRYYKYKTIIIPYKRGFQEYTKGDIGIGFVDDYYEGIHIIGICAVNKKIKTPLKIATKLHTKYPNGKWYWDSSWEPFTYYNGLPMVLYTHNLDSVDKIKIRYYEPYYKRIK